MALYVVKENQELLWNIINNNTFVHQYFTKIGTDKKPGWFRDIISKFYEQSQGQKLTITDLHNINKSTIAYMIDDIRKEESKTIPGYVDTDSFRFQSNGIYTPPMETDNRKEMYASQFDQRQQEYHNMMEKKPPKEIDFREKSNEDAALTNMDELMKQQLLQRERELDIYKPASAALVDEQPASLKIDNSSNIQIEMEEIDDVEEVKMTVDIPPTKKSVSWEDGDIPPVNEEIQRQVDAIDTKYTELFNASQINEGTVQKIKEDIETRDIANKSAFNAIDTKYTELFNASQINEGTVQKIKEDIETRDIANQSAFNALSVRVKEIENLVAQTNEWKARYVEVNDKYEALQMHTNLLTKQIETISAYIETKQTEVIVEDLVTTIEQQKSN